MTSTVKAVDALLALLERGDEVDRCHAAQALGTIHDDRALEPLYRHLQDEDLDVCIDAAAALGSYNRDEAVQGLIDALQFHSDADVKLAALEGLSHSTTPLAIATLERLLTRPDDIQWSQTEAWDDWWDLQRQAVRSLGEHAISGAAPALAALLDSDDGQDIESEILKSLVQIGPAGIVELRARLSHAQPRRQRRIATALAFADSDAANALLVELASHSDTDVRVAAARALAGASSADSFTALVALLHDRSPEVQAAALKSLQADRSQARDSLDEAHLLEFLASTDSHVRTAALQLLSTRIVPDQALSPALLECIGKGLDSNDEEELRLSCELAAKFGMQETAGTLRELAQNESGRLQTRRQAIQSIAGLGIRDQATLEMLWALSESPLTALRHTALQALLTLNDAPHEPSQTPTPLDLLLHAVTDTPVVWPADPADADAPQAPKSLEIPVVPPAGAGPSARPNLQQILQSVSDAYPEPLEEIAEGDSIGSTLESITRSNIEATVGIAPELSSDSERILGLVDDLPEEYAEFAEVVRTNARTGERMVRKDRKKPAEIQSDRRMLAARVLGQSSDPATIQPLLACLMVDDADLRREAAESLGQLAAAHPELDGLTTMIGPVATQLRAGNEEIRRACAATLGALRQRASVPALLGALDDPDTMVRIEAIRALAAITGGKKQQAQAGDHASADQTAPNRITAAIIACHKDPEIGVRKAVIESMVLLKRADLELLIPLGLEEGGALTPAAGVALKALCPELATEALIVALEQQSESSIRRLAVQLLQTIHAS